MRKSMIIAAASGLGAVLVSPLGVASAAPAQAASAHHCATRADYKQVHKGQTVHKVNRLLHSRGHVEAKASSGGYRSEI
jgi:hypothetical protein